MKDYNLLEGYGVKLHRLTEDKIEIVRKWRNTPEVQKHMKFREYITRNMQKRWFSSIDNNYNYYFILQYNNDDIGLINIKSINFEKKEGEKGSLIWQTNSRGKGIGTIANYLIIRFAFEKLKLNSLIIHILKTNPRSIHLNKKLGFKLAEQQEYEDNQKYYLNKETFYAIQDSLKLGIEQKDSNTAL